MSGWHPGKAGDRPRLAREKAEALQRVYWRADRPVPAHLIANGDGTFSVLAHLSCERCVYCDLDDIGPDGSVVAHAFTDRRFLDGHQGREDLQRRAVPEDEPGGPGAHGPDERPADDLPARPKAGRKKRPLPVRERQEVQSLLFEED